MLDLSWKEICCMPKFSLDKAIESVSNAFVWNELYIYTSRFPQVQFLLDTNILAWNVFDMSKLSET